MYGKGVRNVKIVHRSGKSNVPADALSRSPLPVAIQNSDSSNGEQVMIVNSSEMDIGTLLAAAPAPDIPDPESLSQAQLNDPDLRLVIEYVQEKKLPEDPEKARHVVLRSALFVIIDHILFYHDSKRGVHQVAVLEQLRRRMLEENHRNLVGWFSFNILLHSNYDVATMMLQL